MAGTSTPFGLWLDDDGPRPVEPRGRASNAQRGPEQSPTCSSSVRLNSMTEFLPALGTHSVARAVDCDISGAAYARGGDDKLWRREEPDLASSAFVNSTTVVLL